MYEVEYEIVASMVPAERIVEALDGVLTVEPALAVVTHGVLRARAAT